MLTDLDSQIEEGARIARGVLRRIRGGRRLDYQYEELVQEGRIAAWKALNNRGTYRGDEEQWRGYFYWWVRKRVMGYWKRYSKNLPQPCPWLEEEYTPVEWEESPPDLLQELLDQVVAGDVFREDRIDGETQREILLYYFQLGISTIEIGRLFDMSQQSVDSFIKRAIKKYLIPSKIYQDNLKELLEKYGCQRNLRN